MKSWMQVRHRREAWFHVTASIAGGADTATCTICQSEVRAKPNDRPFAQLYRELARKHYYKHKIVISPDPLEGLTDVGRDLFDHSVVAVDRD